MNFVSTKSATNYPSRSFQVRFEIVDGDFDHCLSGGPGRLAQPTMRAASFLAPEPNEAPCVADAMIRRETWKRTPMNAQVVSTNEPPRRPDWEVPPPNPAPETTPKDPVNVPAPGPDVIFPGGGEPIGIPPAPGPDIPGSPTPPEF